MRERGGRERERELEGGRGLMLSQGEGEEEGGRDLFCLVIFWLILMCA